MVGKRLWQDKRRGFDRETNSGEGRGWEKEETLAGGRGSGKGLRKRLWQERNSRKNARQREKESFSFGLVFPCGTREDQTK